MEREGVDFRRDRRATASPVAVLAIHGGAIEPGTSEVARAVAGDDMSWYCFDGVKPRGNGILHVASTRFDDPLCLDLVAKANLVLAVHGSNGTDPRVLVSGLAQDLVARLVDVLGDHGFHAGHDRGPCAGLDPRNVCNRGRGGRGVQLELSRGLRRALFRGLSRRDREVVTPSFHRFVEAVRSVLASGPSERLSAEESRGEGSPHLRGMSLRG